MNSEISKTDTQVDNEIFQKDEDEVQSETGNTEDGAVNGSDEEEEKQEPTDQNLIDDAFIKQLSLNWPLKCYFRTLKRSILVTLGADKIPSKEVPKWRKEVF